MRKKVNALIESKPMSFE